jgi:hypothetical protein
METRQGIGRASGTECGGGKEERKDGGETDRPDPPNAGLDGAGESMIACDG